MESIWSQTTEHPNYQTLNKDIKTDVLIIGAGIAGLLCGYMLKKRGIECVLVDADRVCGKITKDTTAKITLQHGLIYSKIAKYFNTEYAKLYLKAQLEAIEQYQTLCKDIDCDYKQLDSYVYSIRDRKKIEDEVGVLKSIGYPARLVNDLPLPLEIKGAFGVSGQAQFHPLKFLYAISRDLTVYENTRVARFVSDGALTERGKITCKRVIVATHFPFLNKHGSYFLKMYQHRSYVIALENAAQLNGMYVDEDLKGLSFRECDGLLLIGGGSHRTGKKGGNWNELSAIAHKHYPGAKEICRWATQDCMTLDSVPYIGRYCKGTPDLYVATGFNKWGMSNAMVSALLLADLITGKKNAYERVFSPSRTILRPQLAINAAESIVGLITPTAPRCTHLGCALKYNKQEHSWDCSCHGSRFTDKGELINNPATKAKTNL